jgi:glycerol-3-phosphate dehydrogenase
VTDLPHEPLDLLVVGGGINGAAIARDAAGRGLRVMLCEQFDLAAATSSASSKLIHGGLRYLEHFAFGLVRQSLIEREVLLRGAPHIVRPLRFVLPHDPGLRPRWLIRGGLFLYDRLGARGVLPGAASLRLRGDTMGEPLQERIGDGFAYSDCRVDDARLVVLVARDAARRGAAIMPRTRVDRANRDNGLWRVRLCRDSGGAGEVSARVLVNAAGPWVADILRLAGIHGRAAMRLVKGSHIVVPRLYMGEQAYLLQNEDRRVVFVIPFEDDFSLIGTTELPFAGDAAEARISPAEIDYLCRAVGRWFRRPLEPSAIVWSYSGVRPLFDDGAASAAAVTRDHVLELDTSGGAPALSVFGGKITTHRKLAEQALDRLAPHLPAAGAAWTATSVLPGGDGMPAGGPAALARQLRGEHPFLDAAVALRYARAYGTDAYAMLRGAGSAAALGRDFGYGLNEREIAWLVEKEWARTPEDILWRRSKLGLHLGPAAAQELASCIETAAPLRRGAHAGEDRHK